MWSKHGSSLKYAKVLSIVLVLLSFLVCLGANTRDEQGKTKIAEGILMILINGILVFGAFKPNSKAILVWMILAIVGFCFGLAVVIFMVYNEIKKGYKFSEDIMIFFFVDTTIFLGKNFKVAELQYGSTYCGVFKLGVQNWKDFCIRIKIPKENY